MSANQDYLDELSGSIGKVETSDGFSEFLTYGIALLNAIKLGEILYRGKILSEQREKIEDHTCSIYTAQDKDGVVQAARNLHDYFALLDAM